MSSATPILKLRLEGTGDVRQVNRTLRIGRDDDNGWVIDANREPPRVSRRHCEFAMSAEGSTVIDLGSLNGTTLNGRRLPPHAATPVRSGDIVGVTIYKFVVEMHADPSKEGSPSHDQDFEFPLITKTKKDEPPGTFACGSMLELALSSLIDSGNAPGTAGHSSESSLVEHDDLVNSVRVGASELIPPSDPRNAALLRVPRPEAPAPPAKTEEDTRIASFLAGAGLTTDDFAAAEPAVFLRKAGEIFAAMADGYRQILKVRDRIKNEARLKRTVDGAERNNPLKQAFDGKEAALDLLRTRGKAYLPPRAAVRDATNGLIAHELAMLEAFQAALSDMLDALHPSQVEKRLGDTASLLLLAQGGRRAALWTLYLEHHAKIAGTARTRALGAFDNAFRDAYERRVEAVEREQPADGEEGL